MCINIIYEIFMDLFKNCSRKKTYKRYDLTVRVDMTKKEVTDSFNNSMRTAVDHVNYNYYNIYLRHLLGSNTTAPLNTILKRLHKFKETVDSRIENTDSVEERFVRGLLTRNEYISKSTRRPGVTVKMFRGYNGQDVMVKTYVYDGHCPSLDDRMMATFKDEVLFQYYSNNLNNLDFISPELYSWGSIQKYQFIGDNYFYKCLFLIMEYIPGVTLKNATYTKETMKTIYERVKKADNTMIAGGIHHNDLNRSNIMIVEKSPLPEIVILDFGEASFGPRKPLFK